MRIELRLTVHGMAQQSFLTFHHKSFQASVVQLQVQPLLSDPNGEVKLRLDDRTVKL